MKLLTIIVLIFLVFGGFLIVKYNNYKLDNPNDAVSFVADYGKWLFGIGKNTANVVGAAIEQKWLPENTSNQTNTTTKKVKVIYE